MLQLELSPYNTTQKLEKEAVPHCIAWENQGSKQAPADMLRRPPDPQALRAPLSVTPTCPHH